MIKLINLTKVFKSLRAVDSINLEVKQGTILGFLGPNGAGKTTTVEMIEAIRKPTAGSIEILGNNIETSFNEIKEKIGILPQEFHSFEKYTVRETLEFFSLLYKKAGKTVLFALVLAEFLFLNYAVWNYIVPFFHMTQKSPFPGF